LQNYLIRVKWTLTWNGAEMSFNFLAKLFGNINTKEGAPKESGNDDQRAMHGVSSQHPHGNSGVKITNPQVLNARKSAEDRINAAKPTPALPPLERRLTNLLKVDVSEELTLPAVLDAIDYFSTLFSQCGESNEVFEYAIIENFVHYCIDKGLDLNYTNIKRFAATVKLASKYETNLEFSNTLSLKNANILLKEQNLNKLNGFFEAVNRLKSSGCACDNSDESKNLGTILLAANSNRGYAKYAIKNLKRQGVDLEAMFDKIKMSNFGDLQNLLSLLATKSEIFLSSLPLVIGQTMSTIKSLRNDIKEVENSKKAMENYEKAMENREKDRKKKMPQSEKNLLREMLQSKNNLLGEIKSAYGSRQEANFALHLVKLFFETDQTQIEKIVGDASDLANKLGDDSIEKTFNDIAMRISASRAHKDISATQVLASLEIKISDFLISQIFSSQMENGQNKKTEDCQRLHDFLISSFNSLLKEEQSSSSSSSSSSPHDSQALNPVSPAVHGAPKSAVEAQFDDAVKKYLATLGDEDAANKIYALVQKFKGRLCNLFTCGVNVGSMINFLVSGTNRFGERLRKLEALAEFSHSANVGQKELAQLASTFLSAQVDHFADINDAIDAFLSRGNSQLSIDAATKFINLLGNHTITDIVFKKDVCNSILDVMRTRAENFLIKAQESSQFVAQQSSAVARPQSTFPPPIPASQQFAAPAPKSVSQQPPAPQQSNESGAGRSRSWFSMPKVQTNEAEKEKLEQQIQENQEKRKLIQNPAPGVPISGATSSADPDGPDDQGEFNGEDLEGLSELDQSNDPILRAVGQLNGLIPNGANQNLYNDAINNAISANNRVNQYNQGFERLYNLVFGGGANENPGGGTDGEIEKLLKEIQKL
jgi:hypothetical protein